MFGALCKFKKNENSVLSPRVLKSNKAWWGFNKTLFSQATRLYNVCEDDRIVDENVKKTWPDRLLGTSKDACTQNKKTACDVSGTKSYHQLSWNDLREKI